MNKQEEAVARRGYQLVVDGLRTARDGLGSSATFWHLLLTEIGIKPEQADRLIQQPNPFNRLQRSSTERPERRRADDCNGEIMTTLQAAHWVAELGAAAAWTRTYHCQPRADVPYWAVVYLRAGEHWRGAMLHPEVVDGERGERLEAARCKPFYNDRWPDRDKAINALEQDWWENRCCCGSPSMCAPNGPIHWVELASVDSDTF